MPITPERLKKRRRYIGSSDMAAVMGVSPWGTAYDVYMAKTDQLEKQKGNMAMSLGTALEDGLLNLAAEKLGPITHDVFKGSDEFHIGSSVDGLVDATGECVEVKTGGLTNYDFSDEWGQEGTNEVPPQYICQAHVHMICHGAKVCHLPALIGGRGFLFYRIDYDEELAGAIKVIAKRFWEDHVLKRVAPQNSIPSEAVYKRIRRVPETTVDMKPKIIENWLEAKEREKVAKAEKTEAQCTVMGILGTAEGSNPTDAGSVTYMADKNGKKRTLRWKKPQKK